MNLSIRHLIAAGILCLPALCHASDQSSSQQQDAPPATAQSASAPAAPAEVSPPTAAPADPAAQTPAAAPSAAAAPAQVAGGKIAPPPAGKGQIIFFREKHFAGAAVSFKVREGDKALGKLSSGSYFVAVLDPGAHDFAVHSENKDALHMEVEAGETYYVAGSISMGFLVGETHIAPSDEATFLKNFDKLKLSSD